MQLEKGADGDVHAHAKWGSFVVENCFTRLFFMNQNGPSHQLCQVVDAVNVQPAPNSEQERDWHSPCRARSRETFFISWTWKQTFMARFFLSNI